MSSVQIVINEENQINFCTQQIPCSSLSAQTVSQATLSIKVKRIFTNITKDQSLLFNLIYLSVLFSKDLRLCRLSIWISFICTPTFLILLLNPAIAASSAKRRFSVLWNIVALKNDFFLSCKIPMEKLLLESIFGHFWQDTVKSFPVMKFH